MRKIGKVFDVRWLSSSYRTVDAVFVSLPALVGALERASVDSQLKKDKSKAAEYKVSNASIRRERMKHRKAIAEGLKAEFRSEVPLTIHWDGKLLPDITGKETVDLAALFT